MSHITHEELFARIDAVDPLSCQLGTSQRVVINEATEQPAFLISALGINFVVDPTRITQLPRLPEDLRQELLVAESNVRVRERWAHNKHPDKPYEIIAIAICLLGGDASICVIYEETRGSRNISWARSIGSFCGYAETNDGRIVKRFTKV